MAGGRRLRCVALLLAAAAWCAAGPGPPALRFPRALYNLTVPENSPPRTYAEPPPGAEHPAHPAVPLPSPDTKIRFRIRHGDRDKFFKAEERIVGDLCFLLIRTRAGHTDVLNRERRDTYRLDVRATAQLSDGTQLEADTVLVVEVTDENDLSPLFYPTEYEALVPEDTPLHSSIARVTAEDADLGINGEIYYSLAELTDRFAVHPSSGVVTVTCALVAAEKTRYEITVLARDRASLLTLGENAPAARATLTIRVAPVNLHAPELRVRRLPELVENSTAEIYAIVEVTDRDVGEHGRIAVLEIVDGDPDGHFRVRPSEQPNEYDIVVHALLDRETSPRGYNLTLRASDAGRPPRASYLTLPVTLVDANDNAPVFSREIYEANVPETAPPNTPVIRLKVSDRDEGRNARVYIEIVGGNEGGEFFVNPDTGVLYTAVPLDAEQKSLYTLTVSAIDQGNAGTRKQSSAKVKIGIVDANDNNPVFDRDDMTVTLAENGPTGVVVARVSARDADSGENAYISYSVANIQPIPFEVDHFSGAVRTTKLLDYESMRREYVLRIRASDWGLPYRRQAEMRLTVRLEDVNDNRPQFERVDCVGYLPRRLAIGYEIVTLSAIDFDSGDVVSYRLVGGNEDNCFALDSGTGVVSLSCDLADVRAETRVLNVTATDGTHFADPTSLTLHLVGGAGVGASAGEVGALECRDTGVARRLIELLAAAERSNAPIDFTEDFPLAPSRYGENLHAPEFIDFPVEVKVNESVALGTSLVRLHARDRDLGYNGLLVYAISGGDADSAFRIDPDNGELKVIGYLDREKEHEYYLNITVYDLGVPQRSSSRLLPVTVLDVNDNAPKFVKTLSSFRVTENAINGTVIFRANATDRDAGEFARIEYSVTGASAGEFCVERESGLLAVCAPLDRERHALYELSVRATDGGGLRAEALVRVAVDDVNDNAPRFALPSYSARVREDVPVGTPVAVLEAFDPDLGAGGLITYSLPDQATEDVVFTVDSTSGTVRTAKRLDYEEKQTNGKNLQVVRVQDGGQPALWAEATLVVEVGDVDENRHTPAFAERAAVALAVREDAAPGARVGTLLALDADPPGRDSRLAYYALDGPGMAHFAIDDTGVVRTLAPLDRERAPHYWLTACAEDHGLVPRHACIQVFVEVLDVNDVAPWPERAAYFARVPEHCAAGTRVAVVRAPDGDAEPRAVHYSIVAGNPDGLFAIDDRTGEIVTTGRALDREAASAHALEVRAWDGALAANVRVRVDLTDLNDHAPAFTQRFYDLRVPAPAPAQEDEITTEGLESSAEGEAEAEGEADAEAEGDSEAEEEERGGWDEWDEWGESDSGYVYIATASDPDGDPLYYDIVDGDPERQWAVGREDGSLVLVRGLQWERRPHYALNVSISDGRRALYTTVNITVVNDVHEGGVEFERELYTVEVSESARAGDTLVALRARVRPAPGAQAGAAPEPRLLYGILAARVPADAALFRLHELTGVLELARPLDRFASEEVQWEVAEDAAVGTVLGSVEARSGTAVWYELRGGAGLFRLNPAAGVLALAAPLDYETCARHDLVVTALNMGGGAASARVTVHVLDRNEFAPVLRARAYRGRISEAAARGALVCAD
ncbi:Fat-like cadherin-related tumor suppressor-like [Papilio machaon]|uniref:Fat-like cadherin-related tumor suppressor-like n=1 Tax=Papilio machaon TaxID=76193 RepID=A0A0N0PCI1_PAPMA|nr:Fat-like cadherin-related tumor suppressor-like [Papilio machaon]